MGGSGLERHLRKKTKGKNTPMNTTTATATVATKQRDVLQKKLDTLNQQSRETESALSRERATHANLTAKRTKLLEGLVGTDAATAGSLHREIDSAESALRASSRVAEGLSNSLSRINNEKSSVASEFSRTQETCEQERRALLFNELQAQLWAHRRAAEDAANAYRVALFKLNSIAVQGKKDCGPQGEGLAEFVISGFQHQQRNPDVLLGWQFHGFEIWGDLHFKIQPGFQPKAKI
jgi:chromosome segregation ATPase